METEIPAPGPSWKKKSSSPQAQPPNLCCLSTGPMAVASMQLGACCRHWVLYSSQPGCSILQRGGNSAALASRLLAQAISGENKTKLTVTEEGKELVKLCCWNRNWELDCWKQAVFGHGQKNK